MQMILILSQKQSRFSYCFTGILEKTKKLCLLQCGCRNWKTAEKSSLPQLPTERKKQNISASFFLCSKGVYGAASVRPYHKLQALWQWYANRKIKGAISIFYLICDDGNLGIHHDDLIKLYLYLSRVLSKPILHRRPIIFLPMTYLWHIGGMT